MQTYQSYTDVLDKGKRNEKMNYRDKQKLIKLIDNLDTKDHVGILKIIMDSSNRKIYTVNNYGTYFDLNDVDNPTLWQISYHVSLCIENVEREKNKKEAEKKYLEDKSQLEDNLRNKSKLKLTANHLNLSKSSKSIKNDDIDKNKDITKDKDVDKDVDKDDDDDDDKDDKIDKEDEDDEEDDDDKNKLKESDIILKKTNHKIGLDSESDFAAAYDESDYVYDNNSE